MTPEQYREVDRLFGAAMELEPDQRAAYLAEACGSDEALRREVESLLGYEARSGFLDRHALEVIAQEMTKDPATSVIGRNFGHFRVLSLLGKGGMGEVYLGEDTRLGRKVAIKLLPAEFTTDAGRVRRFEQEARASSSLNHPNIITIHDIGEIEGKRYIVEEFIDGETLRQRMTDSPQQRMEIDRALDIATQMAKALAAAHEAGIAHRDIKPENVMVRHDGLVKVLDFGLAKLTYARFPTVDSQAATVAKMSTETGVVMGTAHYMSPEQARGQKVDARTDIFSLGTVLYEMIAGSAPFKGTTMSDVIAALLKTEPLPLAHHSPGIPAELWRIVSKALTKDREERYQTIKDLFLDLKRLKQRLEFETELERSRQPKVGGDETTIISSMLETIETVPKTGGTSSNVSRTALPLRRRRSRRAINSLAVLPLVNASADANAEYLSDGITESIINSLSQVPRLRVIARSTVFRYKGREVDPQEVGRELNVRAVLSGRVSQLGNSLVIATELVDTADGSQIWGEQYNRKPSDVFAVQAEIAKQISEKLRLHLTSEQKKRLTKQHTVNIVAYQHYLRGRYHWNKRTAAGFNKAIEYFQQAIVTDPGYAPAYVGIADCYALLPFYDEGSPMRFYHLAKTAATRALEIDDTLAEAHTSLGHIQLYYDWDWALAERELKRAIELAPTSAETHHVYGYYLSAVGRSTDAIREFERSLELDPVSLPVNASLGLMFYLARQYGKAIQQQLKTIELDANFAPAHAFLGWAYAQHGMYGQAIVECEKALSLVDAPWILTSLGYTHALAGDRGAADQVLDQLKERAKQGYVSPYDLAVMYAGLGNHEQALAHLEAAYEERSGVLIWGLQNDPRLDGLRAEAAFAELLRRVGFAS
jgi:eukaryotic-like serine/threonine-protein kinase